MAIKLIFNPDNKPLTGCSKWWGPPDLPPHMEYPHYMVDDQGDTYPQPLTFLCQIRCEDLQPYDPRQLLPHTGMLYFFAELDYFMGTADAIYPGMGPWPQPYYRVLYSPTCQGLSPYEITFREDGRPIYLPPVALSFDTTTDYDDSYRLLGHPYYEEIRDLYPPDMISLLQIDENDDWNLRFIDCGMLCFMISPADLANRYWDGTLCYLHSF